ncbi:MAG: sulfotransferase family protein [Rhodobacteraceae bacterium]|nr:sulfotransferase family protein [Paracoccaceae bacterium]
MTVPSDNLKDFRRILDDTLALLDDTPSAQALVPDMGPPPLPSLLKQCEAALAQIEAQEVEPIRTLHHFACTGGTLISQCLAVSPNVFLFSEIDPLSIHHLPQNKRPFFPTDLLADLRYSPRPVPQYLKEDFFLAGLKSLHQNLSDLGQAIILRDHTHSQFCLGTDVSAGPHVSDLAAQVAPILSIVTVRHPLDSYMSLGKNDWIHFSPATLQEYCRRYLIFLEAYRGRPLFRYEDFLSSPKEQLRLMLDQLDLEPIDDFNELRDLFHLSGDSGRRGAVIAPRPRREISESLQAEVASSSAYAVLCKELDYIP